MKMTKERRITLSWAMYDWANSAFATTIMAAVLPIYYSDVAAKTLTKTLATSYWGYTQSIAMLVVAISAPILGAMADYSRAKMKFLKFFVFLGAIFTASLYFIRTGDYLLCSIMYIIADLGFAGGNVFYNALLPEITTKDNIDWVSTLGFALGYFGGGILLLINIMMIQFPKLFFIPNATIAARLSFTSVGIWWLLFSMPIFRNVRDRVSITNKRRNVNYVSIGFERVFNTFREIRKYKELFKFLLAFWIYNDGISTIIVMATIYGRSIGIGRGDLLGALLMTQFIGIPCSLLFGKLAHKIGTRNGIYLALSVYALIAFWGFFMKTAITFWILAGLVGLVQGGSQALSRSLFATLTPLRKDAEFFGFYGISSKLSAIIGPFIFALLGQLTGSTRIGIFALVAFFLIGILVLSRVNIEEGRKIAREES